MRLDPHARYRELLAARLDRPLARPESRVLNAHLKGCAECQQTERDYREQRQMLRGLSQPIPPRDLWARTPTALDRELGRYPHRYPNVRRRLFGRRVEDSRPGGAPSAITTIVTALAVVTLLGVMQLAPLRPQPQQPSNNTSDGTATAGLLATPFAVVPQQIAILAGNDTDYSVWETSINQVCPNDTLDCFDDADIVRRQVVLPGQFRPQNVALSPNGERLAVVGTESNRDVIAVVMLMGSGGTVDPNATPRTTPRASEPPPDTPEPATAKPATPDVTAPPEETPTTDTPSSPSTEPEPTDQATEPVPTESVPTEPVSTEPASTDPVPTDPVPTDPVPTEPASTEPSGPEPSETPPTHEPPATSEAPTDDPTPAATPTRQPRSTSGGPDSTPVAPATAAPTREPESPPPSAVPGLTVLSILEDVHSAGAPPAWSRDGSALAFSAMPADGSHGPDVYVWEPGDDKARAITGDHTSFFASWSGTGRVVISRLTESDDRSSPVRIETVVADLESGAERAVDGPQMWLPSVDDQREQAVVWRGEIERDGLLPVLGSGALYLADWSALDPYSESVEPGVSAADAMIAVEPERDADVDPVRDWHARWSSDGLVFGIWEGNVTGATWGSLTLYTMDAEGGLAEKPLFDLNLAKRGFTLGSDRIAWIAGNENTEGELRIRTWGLDGEGGLRIQPPIEGELVPAF